MIFYPDPVLTMPCHEVESFDSELSDLADLLTKETASVNGYSVAAPQIGILRNLFAYKLPDGQTGIMVNPRITESSGSFMYHEGCLSIPDKFWWISRPDNVTIDYYDLKGDRHTRFSNGLVGRIWQHELDHLAGRLILTRITKNERKKFERELVAA